MCIGCFAGITMADIKAALQNTATQLTAADVTNAVGLSPVRIL